jgi:hypothetical protein
VLGRKLGEKKKKKKMFEGAPPRAEAPRVPFGMAIRMFLVGSIAVVAAVYAIWRHYSVPLRPMVVPAAPSASEVPAPDIETVP